MNTQRRLRMSMKHFLIFTSVMLLPGLLGVLDFFDPKKSQLDLIHFACVAPYILYAMFQSKFLSRKIEVVKSEKSGLDKSIELLEFLGIEQARKDQRDV